MEALSLYAKLMNEDPVYAMYAKLQSQQYYMQQPGTSQQVSSSLNLTFLWRDQKQTCYSSHLWMTRNDKTHIFCPWFWDSILPVGVPRADSCRTVCSRCYRGAGLQCSCGADSCHEPGTCSFTRPTSAQVTTDHYCSLKKKKHKLYKYYQGLKLTSIHLSGTNVGTLSYCKL